MSASRLQRYIFFMLLPTWLGLLAGLVGLAALVNSITFLSKVINENMPIMVLIKFVTFGMPVAMWLVTPLTLMLAIMIIYSRLRSDSELVVMQSVGVSQFRIGMSAIACSLIGIVLMSYLVSTLMPQVNREFRKTKHELVFALSSSAIQTGVFMSPIPGVTMYVREKKSDSGLVGVMVHDQRDPALDVTINANSATIDQQGESFVMTFNKATRTELDKETTGPGVFSLDGYTYPYTPESKGGDVVFVKPRELYIHELWHKYSTNEHPRRNEAYLAELIDRLLSPLLPLGYALVALSIMLAREQGRRSGSQSSMIGIICLVVMEVSRFSFKSVATESFAGAPLFVTSLILPFFIALGIQIMRNIRVSSTANTKQPLHDSKVQRAA